MTVHNFKTSLAKGQVGEAAFLKLWPTPLERLDGRKHDFKLIGTNSTLELKTDSYDATKTENFFMELYSDIDRGKVGGPWQALKNGTTYWCYFFPTNGLVYEFETAKLAEWLDFNWKDYDVCNIRNRTWITVGIKVPRKTLEHLYKVHAFSLENIQHKASNT